ncbi:hypothetical protein Vretimale_13492, partial [Volvox reticuliferus]
MPTAKESITPSHRCNPRDQGHRDTKLGSRSTNNAIPPYKEKVFSGCNNNTSLDLRRAHHATRELDLDGVDVLADAAHVLVHTHAASIDLLGVHTVSRVKVLHLAIWEDAVESWGQLELGAQLGRQSKALLLL